jgi:CrcB protein
MSAPLLRLALVALAGAAGTASRYGVQLGLGGRWTHPAIATFMVNVTGCFLLGIVWSMLHSRDLLAGDLRLVLLTGFLGAFTTFSALMFDTARLARDHSVMFAALNLSSQVAVGLALLGVGTLVGRLL